MNTMYTVYFLAAIRANYVATRAAVLAVLLVALGACQSNPTYQGYSGPAKPDNEIAVVSIPKEFNLLNVNGSSYTQPLMGNGTQVKLLPGGHKVVIKYVDFWDINADNHEKVTSQPILLAFNAQAGDRYQVQFEELKDINAARAFARNPQVQLVDQNGATPPAAEVNYQLEDKGLIAAFVDSLGSDAAPAQSGDTLETLKQWWQKANAQQQEDFLRWVEESRAAK